MHYTAPLTRELADVVHLMRSGKAPLALFRPLECSAEEAEIAKRLIGYFGSFTDLNGALGKLVAHNPVAKKMLEAYLTPEQIAAIPPVCIHCDDVGVDEYSCYCRNDE